MQPRNYVKGKIKTFKGFFRSRNQQNDLTPVQPPEQLSPREEFFLFWAEDIVNKLFSKAKANETHEAQQIFAYHSNLQYEGIIKLFCQTLQEIFPEEHMPLKKLEPFEQLLTQLIIDYLDKFLKYESKLYTEYKLYMNNKSKPDFSNLKLKNIYFIYEMFKPAGYFYTEDLSAVFKDDAIKVLLSKALLIPIEEYVPRTSLIEAKTHEQAALMLFGRKNNSSLFSMLPKELAEYIAKNIIAVSLLKTDKQRLEASLFRERRVTKKN